MSPYLVLGLLIGYFLLLIIVAFITSKNSDTNDFFVANRQAPWYLVAFGMVGTSISGVTFISIPGSVYNPKLPEMSQQFSYFQVVLGYILGYWVIGTILMPLYYRLNLISIYGYLETRLGKYSYKTGAFFFLLSRTLGASLRLFLAANVLQLFLFDAWNVPFWLTTFICIFLIWVYTFKGGIKTIIWTDTLQTAFLLLALVISIGLIMNELNFGVAQMVNAIAESPYSRIFFFDDINDSRNFFKQFLSGAFIAIVMTGLDQDLMQKNLSCKNIQEAQKNMFWFVVVLVIVNILFLSLGALLYLYATTKGVALPTRTDDLYPILALNHFGKLAGITFILGITASTYASADSALASLTTSFCVDFLNVRGKEEAQRKRLVQRTHIGFSLLLVLVILIFKALNDDAVITSLLKLAGYTYGPLLGLFSFGLFTSYKTKDQFVPIICIASPVLCYFINMYSKELLFGYQFGFELLILNGLLTFLGLYGVSTKEKIGKL